MEEVLRELADNASNTREAMERVGDFLAAEVDQKFESGGPGWPGLAASTRKHKGAIGQILVDTGALRESVGIRGSDDYVEVFDSKRYAKYHVEGNARLPKRDFLDVLTDENLDKSAEIVIDEILK